MSNGSSDSESRDVSYSPGQYNAASSARQRSAGSTRRLLYFGFASVWGFLVGVVGVLVAMSAAGQNVEPSTHLVPSLIPAFLIAAAGSFMVAAAYKESKRRSR